MHSGFHFAWFWHGLVGVFGANQRFRTSQLHHWCYNLTWTVTLVLEIVVYIEVVK
jgi:hypothetical protein